MGFLPDVRRLLDQTSEKRQTVLFSATLDNDVKVLIDRYQNDPIIHEVGEVEPDLSLVDHRFIKVKKTERTWLAADVIDDAGPTVVFVRTRHGVDRLARQLKNEGIKAGYIHGGRSQSQRDRALKVFIDGKVDALVATDVAARGIHVDGVACVIHYDPPADIKDYVHRSGRTARAGAGGMVVSFLDGPQVKESEKMQRKLGIDSEIEPVPARKPRSSRPATVDDRHGEAPKRQRNTGENKKPRGPKKDGKPKGRPDQAEARSNRSKKTERFTSEVDGPSRSKSSGSKSRNGKPGGRPGGPSGGKPARKRADGGRPDGRSRDGDGADTRTEGRRSPKKSGKGASSSPSTRSSGKPSGGSSGKSSGKAAGRSAGKAAARKGAGGGTKSASKRTGKPRPKNRKNKPKTSGRRS